MFKRIIAVCVALVLVLGAVGSTALAARIVYRPNTTLSVGSVEIPEEGEAMLPIMISGNEGMMSIYISLTLDRELFTVEAVKRGDFAKRGSVFVNIDSFNDGRVDTLNLDLFNASGNIYSDGCVFEIYLKIKDGAAVGTYPVQMTYDPHNTLYSENIDDITHSSPQIIGMKIMNGTVDVVHNWDEGVPVDSSCVAGAFDTLHTCTVCGETKIEPGIDAHPWELTASRLATCTDDGGNLYTCTECRKTRIELLPALGHDYVVEEVIEPTELEDGYTVYKCVRCGDSYRDAYTEPSASAIKGDVDGGGSVDNADLVILARFIVGLEETLPSTNNADMDVNGKIDNGDLVALARRIVEI